MCLRFNYAAVSSTDRLPSWQSWVGYISIYRFVYAHYILTCNFLPEIRKRKTIMMIFNRAACDMASMDPGDSVHKNFTSRLYPDHALFVDNTIIGEICSKLSQLPRLLSKV
jgi:hypothetical protein